MYLEKFSKRIDSKFLFENLKELINTPSPVGFYDIATPVLKEKIEKLGFSYFEDERHNIYVEVDGQIQDRTVMVGAHMDTLGYMVSAIKENGKIKLKGLGGVQNHSLENEKCYLYTRDLKFYTGYICCIHHSTHVFDDTRDMARDIENIEFLLDADVHSRDEVRALGINVGDWICPEPRFEYMENGRIRSRFIDNKASVAVCFSVLKYLANHRLKPKYRTLFAFTYYEEMNGGGFVPSEVREYVAMDIGAIGDDNLGTERSVSIVAADMKCPYDRALTSELIEMAEGCNIPYSVEVFPRYSTDAMTAFLSGNNLKHAAFGMNVYGSHGMERTFFDSIYHAAELCLSYVLRENN